MGCTRLRSWLRHWATGRKVAGSICDGVNGIFHSYSPSGRTMVLGLTQSLTEMSTRNISWGAGLRRPVRTAVITFMCQLSWNLGALTFWNPQGLSRPVQGLLYLLATVKNVISLNFTCSTISFYSLLISSILCCSVLISFSLTSSPLFSKFQENNTYVWLQYPNWILPQHKNIQKWGWWQVGRYRGPNDCEKGTRLERNFKRNTKAPITFLCGSFKQAVMTRNVWRLNLVLFMNSGRKIFWIKEYL